MILGVDDLSKFKNSRRLVNALKQWTSSTLFKLESGKFGNPVKKIIQTNNKIETTQREAKDVLKTVDASRFTDEVCKSALSAVINKIQEKMRSKQEFSEEKLENAMKRKDNMITEISATNLTDLTPTNKTQHTIEVTDKTPFHIK